MRQNWHFPAKSHPNDKHQVLCEEIEAFFSLSVINSPTWFMS